MRPFFNTKIISLKVLVAALEIRALLKAIFIRGEFLSMNVRFTPEIDCVNTLILTKD